MKRHRNISRIVVFVTAFTAFFVGRISNDFFDKLFSWPHAPDWIDLDATGIVVNGLVALGTFIAAWVALWATQSERRRREQADSIAGSLAAANAVDTLRNLLYRVEHALRISDIVYSERFITAQRIRVALRDSKFLDDDTVRGMTPLDQDCAIQIASAQGRIRLAMQYMDMFPPSANAEDGDHLLARITDALLVAKTLLANSIKICDTAITTIPAIYESAMILKAARVDAKVNAPAHHHQTPTADSSDSATAAGRTQNSGHQN
ncbi:hypothetical protein [Burkholderia gladioli]|uniref:hypothetical protein n=1 Tax=Burkholderia gladioli TaxID=28095 RepID=UPI0012D96B47|nr:hypothetical protein [Burkholderia gladioli]